MQAVQVTGTKASSSVGSSGTKPCTLKPVGFEMPARYDRRLAGCTTAKRASSSKHAYNVCPTTNIDTIVGQNGKRWLVPMRWGLVPSWWSKPLKELKLATFNARVRTEKAPTVAGAKLGFRRTSILNSAKAEPKIDDFSLAWRGSSDCDEDHTARLSTSARRDESNGGQDRFRESLIADPRVRRCIRPKK